MRLLAEDLRIALRELRRHPTFATASVLTLTLGIGATTSVFTIVNTVLLRPLPYPNSAGIVQLFQHRPSDRSPGTFRTPNFSRDHFDAWREQTRTLSHMAMFRMRSATMTGRGGPVRVWGSAVSAAFFRVMGTPPLLGRTFLAEEDQYGREPVIILNYAAWAAHFGSDPAILNQIIQIDDQAHRVIGIMPAGFEYPGVLPSYRPGSGRREGGSEFWMPLIPPSPTREAPVSRASFSPQGSIVARLSPGVSLEQALAEARTIVPGLPNSENSRPELILLYEQVVGPVRPALQILLAAVFLVLAVAVANVASLTLARVESRQHEMAVRSAMGAGRVVLARQALAESLVVALLGGLGGCGGTYAATRAVGALGFGTLPRLDELRVDVTVILFTLSVCVLTALLFGAAPALRALWADPATALRTPSGPARNPVQRASRVRGFSFIAMTQVAVATMLLTASGLMTVSFARLTRVDPGFDPHGVVTFTITLPQARYPNEPQRRQIARELAAALERFTGIDAVALSNSLPFQILGTISGFKIVGEAASAPPVAAFRIVAPGYFQTLRIPVLQGRAFDERDRDGQPPVAIVSEAFVRRLLGERDPLKVQLDLGKAGPVQIVGIVGSARHQLNTDLLPELYLPYYQLPEGFTLTTLTVGVRTALAPLDLIPRIRRTIRDVDPTLAIDDVATLEQRVSDSIGRTRFYTVAMTTFGTVATALAAFGIYGVLAYSVSRRTREIGIRVALGASRSAILRMVSRQGLTLAAVGLSIGLAGAFLLTRYLQALLWGTSPRDPLIFAGVALLFGLVAWLACYIPARRATQIDPMEALRYE